MTLRNIRSPLEVGTILHLPCLSVSVRPINISITLSSHSTEQNLVVCQYFQF